MNLKSDLPTSFSGQSHLNRRRISDSDCRSGGACGKLAIVSYALLLVITTTVCCGNTCAQSIDDVVVAAELFSTVNGKTIYDKLCASCHGIEGTPASGIAELLNVDMRALNSPEIRQESSREDLVRIVTEGTANNMPEYETRLSQKQINAVVDYILGFSTGAPAGEQ